MLRKDDDIIEDPHTDDIQVWSKNVIHKILKHGRGIIRPLGAHFILTLLHLGIQFVLAQDLQNAADMLHMLCRVLQEDDDVIENANTDDIQVWSENIIHKILKHDRGIGMPLRKT